MKRIRVIFETTESAAGEETKSFGYQIDAKTKKYSTCSFSKDYEPEDVSEEKYITDTTEFGKMMWRVIRSALDEE